MTPTVPTGRLDLPSKPNGRQWSRACQYAPELCDLVVQIGAKGGTVAMMRAACEIGTFTFNKWRRDFAEFSEAVDYAKTLAEAQLDEQALANLMTVNSKGEVIYRTDLYKYLKATDHGAVERGGNTLDINLVDNSQNDLLIAKVREIREAQL